jgi:arylsulfatase A-like enzyme
LDTYIKLDKELVELFKFLDNQVGEGQYTVFLTSDHGVADLPQRPELFVSSFQTDSTLLHFSMENFNSNVILKRTNHRLYLDHEKIAANGFDLLTVQNQFKAELSSLDFVEQVFITEQLSEEGVELMLKNGGASGDVVYTLKEEYIEVGIGTTHGSGYLYDTHVPSLWYGPGIPHGRSNSKMNVVDMAPTLLDYLNVPFQNLDGQKKAFIAQP